MSEFKHYSIADSTEKENSRIPLLEKCQQPPKIKSLEEIIYTEYGESIEKIQKMKENESSTDDCLKLHRINEELRSKMVDWMVEVLHIFECSLRTLFLSIRLMDLFFKREKNTLGIEELHVVGVACMMLASKYEDIRPLSMNTIFYKIGHERLPKNYIANVEKRILQIIDYKVGIPTVLDFLEPLLGNCCANVRTTALLIAELTQLNSELSWIRPSFLAQGIYLISNSFGEIIVPSHINFLLYSLKEYLNDFALPFRSSFIKYSASLCSNSGHWFKFSE